LQRPFGPLRRRLLADVESQGIPIIPIHQQTQRYWTLV
jgi:hypothetical protein